MRYVPQKHIFVHHAYPTNRLFFTNFHRFCHFQQSLQLVKLVKVVKMVTSGEIGEKVVHCINSCTCSTCNIQRTTFFHQFTPIFTDSATFNVQSLQLVKLVKVVKMVTSGEIAEKVVRWIKLLYVYYSTCNSNRVGELHVRTQRRQKYLMTFFAAQTFETTRMFNKFPIIPRMQSDGMMTVLI